MPAEGISGRTVRFCLFSAADRLRLRPIPGADGFFILRGALSMPVIMLIIHTLARLLRLEKAQARREH